jgi:hypothetical protein
LLADLANVIRSAAHEGLHPRGHPDCRWATDLNCAWEQYYPAEWTSALDYLAPDYGLERSEERAFERLSRLTYKIECEANRGTPLMSNHREWQRALHMRNDLVTIESRQKSLEAAVQAADQNVTVVQQNLAQGLALELQYRLAETSFLKTKSGLVDTIYLHTVALAEWDWATGRYFQFSKDTVQNVH